MSGSAAAAGSTRTTAAANDAAASPAAAAAASSRVTTRSQTRSLAQSAMVPALSESAVASSSSSPTALAPAAAASAFLARSPSPEPVPIRHADPPSLFSANTPDPLGLILSFALIDLPVALGQPYFPKELVRIVHEYASEACFVLQLVKVDDEGSTLTYSNTRSSSKQLLRWLGVNLPLWPCPFAVRDDDALWGENDPVLIAHCDSCLMDEELLTEYDVDLSRLLHAQLQPHEYRACYLEIDSDEDGKPFDPAIYLDSSVDLEEHDNFCLHALNKRKAKIVARGEKPVAVGLCELLERVRSSLEDGELPRGLSPRPCDWAPLFSWIRGFEEQLNELRQENWTFLAEEHHWNDPPIPPCPCEPVLSAVLVRSTQKAAPVSFQGEAYLWSHEPVPLFLVKPAASMVILEDDDDEEEDGYDFEMQSPQLTSSIAASASASLLTTDEEASARGAPRQRRS